MPGNKIYRLEEDLPESEQRPGVDTGVSEQAPRQPEAGAPIALPEAEKFKEKEPSHGESKTDEEKQSLIKKLPAFIRRTPSTASLTKDEVTKKIEKIMESGLSDAYNRLSPIAKQEFKIKGEETANDIRDLLNNTKIKVKKIIKLIIEWLSMLPGINKFFLEQEAKIKTDRIIELGQSLKKPR